MTNWKPTPKQTKALRDYVLRYEREHVTLEAGERYNTEDASLPPAVNLLLVTSHPDWEDTDLNQTLSLSYVRHYGMIELTEAGDALVDWYCYSRKAAQDLVTNVQSHVRLIEGKPRLWKISGTDAPDLILDEPI